MKANMLAVVVLTGLMVVSPVFAPSNARAQAGEEQTALESAQRIRRIENGFPPIPVGENEAPVQLSLPSIMELYNVPGLSVAVIDGFKIAWAKGYGVTEAGGHQPVTPRTLFQAGSVSKPVAAAGALRLIEQRRLSLDEDVNTKLRTWKIPDNEFTKHQKVTLRRLMTHTAGLTVHGFEGYAAGQPVPTLPQIFNGEKPANNLPVRVHFVPGSKWAYSGGGIVIEQQLMMDVTGSQFPELMRALVFDKLEMNDSTYSQPLPASRAPYAASGTFWNGQVVPGRWHTYPEMAAAGLWTTPSDLARFAIEIARSKHGKSNRILSQATAREMLKPQVRRAVEGESSSSEHPDSMGLGFFVGDDSRPDLFRHDGDDAGFQAMLIMFADSGCGAVVMANSEYGILVGNHLVENIAKEYHWANYAPQGFKAATVLLAVARSRGTRAAIETYRRLKKSGAGISVPDRETLISFAYWLFAQNKRQDAIEVAELESHEYPDYWNAFDTLGEMYMRAGERARAIQSYEKSLALNPESSSGINALRQLHAESRDRGLAANRGKKVYVCPPCGLDCDRRTFDKPGVCPQCGMALVEKTEVEPSAHRTVAILLFNGVEIIDYSGPWEVFGAAGFEVHTVAADLNPVKTAFGQRVIPDYTFENCPKTDIVLIPGGNVTPELLNDAKLIPWIQTRSKDARHVMSVCNGAFLLAKAGLLDGLSATTVRGGIAGLAKAAPKTKVVRGQRYVDNGKVITTAGLSAGIDGALHLVSKILGKETARETAFALEYKWEGEPN